MLGFLNINKPANCTSHTVIAKLRKILDLKKIGHMGTLDPMATGVLPIAIGKATKLIPFMDDKIKAYESEILFGISTDSHDITGKITDQNQEEELDKINDLELLKKSFDKFIGETYQTPPMLSAKKINGKKLYELFRKGKTVERKQSLINISEIKVLDFRKVKKDELEFEILNDLDFKEFYILKFYAKVSRGTYVRSLVDDYCNSLGVCGTTLSIHRVQSGNFIIDSAVDLSEVSKDTLISVDRVVDFQKLVLNEEANDRIQNGNDFSGELILNQDFFNVDKIDKDDKFFLEYNSEILAIGSYKYINKDINKVVFKVNKLLF